MKIIIAGSRDFGIIRKEKLQVFLLLDKIFQKLNLNTSPIILNGCCSGIDACGKEYGISKEWTVLDFPAQWDSLGKAAGPIRNQQMVNEADMLILIRFKDSRGSKDVLSRAKIKGIKIIDIVI